VLLPHFLAQVACQDDTIPSSPLVVANSLSDRAAIIDVSPRAAHVGVRIGMSVLQARQRCPALQVTSRNARAVERATARVERALARHAETIPCVGLGCWALPLYALGSGFRAAEPVAERLRQDVSDQTGFPCTLGLAAHLAVARIAADEAARRPQGVLIVLPGTEADFLAPLPVRALPGVGPRTEAALGRFGITMVGQLAQVPLDTLTHLCGTRARSILSYARGQAVDDMRGTPHTLAVTWQAGAEPCAEVRRLHAELYALTERVGRDLRARQQAAGTLTVRLRWTDGAERQRTITFTPRRDLDRGLAAGSRSAVDALLRERRLAVLEMTVTLGDLGPLQADFFATADSRIRRLQQALDAVKQRFGPRAIQPAALLGLATYRANP
jgi:DNA polymerase-4